MPTLALPNGRLLAYASAGDPDGTPVYFMHGFPGSRLQAELVAVPAHAAGLQLIAFDRPGLGESSPQPGRTIAASAFDVAHLADALGHARFAVLGVSCGGPYALACAAALPARVRHVGLLAGMGPMDLPALRSGQLPALQWLFRLARRHRWLIAPLLVLDRALLLGHPQRAVEAFAKLLSAPDRVWLAQHPDLGLVLIASMAEAYRQGIGAALLEAQLIARPRGYTLAGIDTPVDIFQGLHDRHVPPAMGQHLAEHLQNARYHEYPEDGHLSIIPHAFAAYADCLRTAIAGEGR